MYPITIPKIAPRTIPIKIAPGIKKGNTSLLKWTNREIIKLNKEGFFAKDYNQELKPYFGSEVKPSDIILDK